MKIIKALKKFFRLVRTCEKCGFPSSGHSLCEECSRYNSLLKAKKDEEVKSKEELTRRNWIQTRDLFLKEHDGR